ncbi:MAG: 2OG-Fe(II) oxygenase, partial [Gammaproteobacteria bacterium]|nr:2OG-Fe(II) oxygenase [Gammaproteobacteria bacterium]
LIAIGGVHLPRDQRINQRVSAAVQADHPPALRAAAIHFGRRPHAADQALCVQLLERAAMRGDAVAALLLAERLQRGEGCTADPAFAADLRAQLAANGIPARLPAATVAPPGPGDAPLRTLTLEDAWTPAPAQVLATHPRVAVIDNLLSADECRLLMASAHPALRRSHTIDPVTGQPVAHELRTSSDASFDPIVEDLALRLVQLRMAAAAGAELVQAEQLIVLRYEPGQEYRPHRDYLPPGRIERPEAGNRIRTICAYLNQVQAGGQTEFPVAAVKIDPVPGRVVIFDNLQPDGRPDPDALHAGLPVVAGEKWLATLWLRERRYRGY